MHICDTDKGKESTGRETFHSTTLLTTGLTRNDFVMNPSLREENPTTDRLRHGKGSVWKPTVNVPVAQLVEALHYKQ